MNPNSVEDVKSPRVPEWSFCKALDKSQQKCAGVQVFTRETSGISVPGSGFGRANGAEIESWIC